MTDCRKGLQQQLHVLAVETFWCISLDKCKLQRSPGEPFCAVIASISSVPLYQNSMTWQPSPQGSCQRNNGGCRSNLSDGRTLNVKGAKITVWSFPDLSLSRTTSYSCVMTIPAGTTRSMQSDPQATENTSVFALHSFFCPENGKKQNNNDSWDLYSLNRNSRSSMALRRWLHHSIGEYEESTSQRFAHRSIEFGQRCHMSARRSYNQNPEGKQSTNWEEWKWGWRL